MAGVGDLQWMLMSVQNYHVKTHRRNTLSCDDAVRNFSIGCLRPGCGCSERSRSLVTLVVIAHRGSEALVRNLTGSYGQGQQRLSTLPRAQSCWGGTECL